MGNEHESEAQLENHLIRRLSAIGYQTITIKDENSLVTHFRDILNQRNADNLNGVPLTDAEFERVENELIGSKSIYEIAQLLRGSDIQPYGKIEIQRDDNTQLFLNFFDGRNWENNIFEVTHQITIPSKYQNRYDVTILINGMPIVQIELKRTWRGLYGSLSSNYSVSQ
jgi:type I restriction enzyme R subunit